MPEANIVEAELNMVNQGAVEHNKRVMLTALDVLQKSKDNPMQFEGMAFGSKELTRSGMKRQVEFLEVQEGDKILVIEVYTK